jgi:hypothetical protein
MNTSRHSRKPIGVARHPAALGSAGLPSQSTESYRRVWLYYVGDRDGGAARGAKVRLVIDSLAAGDSSNFVVTKQPN